MNRLFELVFLIMDKKKMTASEIATYFEISTRTVLRDIDKLIVAGIPIETAQGHEGGIFLDPTYQLTLEFMSIAEKEALVAGLQAMDSVQAENLGPMITRKLFKQHEAVPSLIDIDLSSWYGTSLIPKIELLKQAILNKQQVSFTYYAHDKQSQKQVSPYQLVFRWGNWYLRGICAKKNEFRLYKLNRMEQLEQLNKATITKTFIDSSDFSDEKNVYLVAKFSTKVKAKLIDSYGLSSFTEEGAYLHFERWFANPAYLLDWILSFGAEVEVLEPLELRTKIKENIQALNKIYERDT